LRALQVQKVVPMLPPRLCEELCSLNPGVDRLAFSLVWDMSAEGDVRRQWAGRSVIRSCAKLAYGDAQAMLEGRFGGAPGEAAPAVALEPPHTWPQARGAAPGGQGSAGGRLSASSELPCPWPQGRGETAPGGQVSAEEAGAAPMWCRGPRAHGGEARGERAVGRQTSAVRRLAICEDSRRTRSRRPWRTRSAGTCGCVARVRCWPAGEHF